MAQLDYLMTETLATEWSVGQTNPLFSIDCILDKESWKIEIAKQ